MAVTNFRQFGGLSNAEVVTSIGACDFDASAGATVAMILKRDSNSDWDCPFGIMEDGSTGGAYGTLLLTDTFDVLRYYSVKGGTPAQSANAIMAADGWSLIVIRDNGTAVDLSRYEFGSASWTATSDPMTGNPSAGPTPTASWEIHFGSSGDFSDEWPGGILLGGMWQGAINDATRDSLAESLANWQDASPAGLWAFDQAAADDEVTDLTGNGADLLRFGAGGGGTISSVDLDFDMTRSSGGVLLPHIYGARRRRRR